MPRPDQADVALIRLQAPFEPRDDLFLEAWFHQGHLDFQPGLPVRLARIAEQCPLVIDVALDRPAILTPLLSLASALTVSVSEAPAPPGLMRSPDGSRRGAGCRWTCRVRWLRFARIMRTFLASMIRCSRAAGGCRCPDRATGIHLCVRG